MFIILGMKALWHVGLAFVALVSCFARAGEMPPNIKNIFGEDAREPVTSRDYPWSAIGYLDTGCTGTLVGPDLVLTAAHCVLKNGKLNPDLRAFYPNRIEGVSYTSSAIVHVWWGTSDPHAHRDNDWAFLRLSRRLGDDYGWMGVQDDPQVKRVTCAGYSSDYHQGLTATAHRGCYIRDRRDGLFYHDCDNTRGVSGGPLFHMKGRDAVIVAMNVAEKRHGGEQSLHVFRYSLDYANCAVPAAAFIAKCRELLR